jgi:NDP-4-keto-2,6-dideoxyhexose 3-C-methyltransferase
LIPLLDKYGLEIFKISLNDINGGSIRTLIKFKENDKLIIKEGWIEAIGEQIRKEKKIGLDTLKPYEDFALRITKIKEKIINFLEEEKKKGKNIWIYGASTRGNVALQYFEINKDLIVSAVDKNPDKDGKKTIGSLIPITSVEKFRAENPDFLLVMVWHFLDEIMNQEKDWFDKGGTFVVALPEFKIIRKN